MPQEGGFECPELCLYGIRELNDLNQSEHSTDLREIPARRKARPDLPWPASCTWTACSGTRSSPGSGSGPGQRPARLSPAVRGTGSAGTSAPAAGSGHSSRSSGGFGPGNRNISEYSTIEILILILLTFFPLCILGLSCSCSFSCSWCRPGGYWNLACCWRKGFSCCPTSGLSRLCR